MISSSLKVSNEVFVHPIVWIPASPQWNNYVKIFSVLPFAKFAWNTVIVTGLAVLGTIVSSVIVGYSFSRLRWPGRQFWFGLMIATMMLPEVVTLIPRFILFRWFNWIDTFLPLIVPYWTGATALYIFLVHQFFRGLPMELEEAALIDGANRVQILTLILLPLSKPVIATVAVFALIQHYNSFLEPLIYLNSMDKWVLALGIRAINDSNVQNWELVFSAGTLMLAPVLLLFVIAQRYFVQGIAMTGFGGR
jgi:ABC-type glycerol-3-phosphate transport system permease component